METKIAIGSLEKVSKQRNLFLILTLILAASILLISIRLVTFDQRIVLVPGLTKELSLSGNSVSSNYLEEMSLLFLSHLLDISSGDIMHKKELVLRYTSKSDSEFIKKIGEYFDKAAEEYKKFDLSTHFTVKNLQIDQKNMQVIANGMLTSWFGKRGNEVKKVSYKVNFEYSGGFLKLKEFVQLIEEVK